MKLRNCVVWALVAAATAIGAAKAEAAAFGIYSNNGTAATNTQTMVSGLGHTATILNDLTAADLVGLDVLWILNSDNSQQPGAMVANIADIDAFVFGGGVLSYHDRNVSDAALVVPGAGAVTFVRDFTFDSNIDVELSAPGLITGGPGGAINNSTLDGGNSSSHGYATLASLPGGAVPVFNNSQAGQIVDFYFAYGAGAVYYSTIPLDYYMGGSGPAGVRANMTGIYAVNEATLQAALSDGITPVPEPGTYMLFATGLVGIAAQAWRRRRS